MLFSFCICISCAQLQLLLHLALHFPGRIFQGIKKSIPNSKLGQLGRLCLFLFAFIPVPHSKTYGLILEKIKQLKSFSFNKVQNTDGEAMSETISITLRIFQVFGKLGREKKLNLLVWI